MTDTGMRYIPPNVRSIFRRSAIAAAVVGGVALVVLVLVGHGLWAVFALLGLALGVANLMMVQRSAAVFADRRGTGKKRLAVGALGRLAIATAVAFTCAMLFRPEGIGVIVGLAVFQFIAVAVAAVPLTKELRTW